MNAPDPRIALLIAMLKRHRDQLREAVERVPAELRETAPAVGGWSVAQVLEHLASTEAAVTRLISSFLASSGARAEDTRWDEDAFRQSIDQAVFLDRSQKIQGSQPPGESTSDEAWTALEVTRGVFLAELDRAGHRRLEDQTRPHPALAVPLDGHQWIAFVALHEGRHAMQIDEIRTSLLAGDAK